MNISFKHDLDTLEGKLTAMAKKQLPFATANALNSVAFKARAEEQRQMPKKLDRPTKFTVNAIQVKKAKKRDHLAIVKVEEKRAPYLHYQIKGGTRQPKGKAIPVPYEAHMKLNKFGNMTKSKVASLLAKKSKPGAGGTFTGKPKGAKHPSTIGGIYQRGGRKGRGSFKMLIHWEPKAQYRARFPFYKIGEGIIRRTFRRELDKALNKAMASAR